MAFEIKLAEKKETFGLVGLRGGMNSGKTATMLRILTAWSKKLGKPFGVIDSERGRASKFVGWANPDGGRIEPFPLIELRGDYSPGAYIDAIRSMVKHGVCALGVDSISHEWVGQGGVLQLAENLGGDFKAWGPAGAKHDDFIAELLEAKVHKVCTMRMEMAYSMEKDDRGKTVVKTLGLETVQRTKKKDINYEFDLVGELDEEHRIRIVKQPPTPIFKDYTEVEPGAKFGNLFLDWLREDAVSLEEQVARERAEAAAAKERAEQEKKTRVAALESQCEEAAAELQALLPDKTWWETKGKAFFEARRGHEEQLTACLGGFRKRISELNAAALDAATRA